MKREFLTQPACVTEQWPGEFSIDSWHNVVMGMPAQLMVVTGWKINGKENACLQAGAALGGSGGEFMCVIHAASKGGHMYQSLRETGCCVLNFPSRDVYDRCYKTIEHNQFEADEITASGLTAEKAASVNAPRIAECFLNIECEFVWEHELFPGSGGMTVALRAVSFAMDSARYDQAQLGRYGRGGYLYYAGSPRNPETGVAEPEGFGVVELLK